jgi:hypothetical protein
MGRNGIGWGSGTSGEGRAWAVRKQFRIGLLSVRAQRALPSFLGSGAGIRGLRSTSGLT